MDDCTRCGFPGEDHSREQCENLELRHQLSSLKSRLQRAEAVVEASKALRFVSMGSKEHLAVDVRDLDAFFAALSAYEGER
jgi:hypothetical protein